MAATSLDRIHPRSLHPLHAVLLAGTVPLFLGALVADIAYGRSYQIQWSNFASWLNAGALVVCGAVLAWALVDLVRSRHGSERRPLYFVLVLVTWIVGFINALVHARDAWGMMPTGLVLSAVVAALACVCTWLGFSSLRNGGAA